MFLKAFVPGLLLTLVSATAAAFPPNASPVIDGEFEIQPYQLPNGQGYRHITSLIPKQSNELIIFGGLGNGGPSLPTPMNYDVFSLDLTKPASSQTWIRKSTDTVVTSPWFTSTRGFVEIDDKYYLACDDTDVDAVYSFDADSYQFTHLSSSPLGPQLTAGDCCAVGVKIRNSRNHQEIGEERIYILGGRNAYASPVSTVRYYSVTHNQWKQVADLNIGRSHLGCVATEQRGEPNIYAIGGGNSPAGEALDSVEVYNVVDDTWTLSTNHLSDGRTRMGVQNIDDKYLLLIGGDSTCAGGGSSACLPDQPLSTVELVDIRNDNRVISSAEAMIPQLKLPRHTPATSLRKRKGNNQKDRYVLYAVGGRTRDAQDLAVLTSTEVLRFDGINHSALPKK